MDTRRAPNVLFHAMILAGRALEGDALVWNWLEWVNALAAIPLAVAGFAIAIQQIRKAKTAAEAASTSAAATLERFKALSSASILPQLATLENALDTAVDHKSVVLLRHVIQNWKWQAGACRQHLDPNELAHTTAMTKIQRSISAATSLKHSLTSFDDTTDWSVETGRLRKAISEVTGELGSLSTHQALNQGQPS